METLIKIIYKVAGMRPSGSKIGNAKLVDSRHDYDPTKNTIKENNREIEQAQSQLGPKKCGARAQHGCR